MKLRRFSLCVLLVMVTIFFVGCKDKNLPQPSLERDRYNTGGNLTFEYDEISHLATFGGEGEVVQFYNEDITKGWTEKGCRIGVQILVPKEAKDYKSGSAALGNNKLTANDYLNEIGENKVAVFYPIVDEEHKDITLKITWQDGKIEQTYHIHIKAGTIFMKEEDRAETTKISTFENK